MYGRYDFRGRKKKKQKLNVSLIRSKRAAASRSSTVNKPRDEILCLWDRPPVGPSVRQAVDRRGATTTDSRWVFGRDGLPTLLSPPGAQACVESSRSHPVDFRLAPTIFPSSSPSPPPPPPPPIPAVPFLYIIHDSGAPRTLSPRLAAVPRFLVPQTHVGRPSDDLSPARSKARGPNEDVSSRGRPSCTALVVAVPSSSFVLASSGGSARPRSASAPLSVRPAHSLFRRLLSSSGDRAVSSSSSIASTGT